MKYRQVLLALTALTACVAATMPLDRAHAENAHHMHRPAEAGQGYQRSVASYRIPDVRLVDMAGNVISLQDRLSGNDPVMLNFIFTSCTAICPVMSATFHDVQEELGDERDGVRMVSISIDPENDTPARLREYAGKFQAGPQWHMLTGSVGDSIAVQRAFGVFRGDKMNHVPVTFLRGRNAGNVWVRLDGLARATDIVMEYRKLAAR